MGRLTSRGQHDQAMSLLNTVSERKGEKSGRPDRSRRAIRTVGAKGGRGEHHIHFSVPSPLTFAVQCINGLLLSPFII